MFKINRSVAALILTLAILLSLFSAFPVAYAHENNPDINAEYEMGTIEEIISSYYDPDGRPMSCAHRAITSIKNNPIPENSLVAIQACIDAKVDIVELDIMRTKDGVYVLCHDDTIDRTTTGKGKVSDLTYNEIKSKKLREYTGGNTAPIYYDENGNTLVIPTFEEALKMCKDNCMINLDKFDGLWDYRMEIYELVRANGCLDNVMFKSDTDRDVLAWHNEIRREYGSDAKMPNYCYLYANDDAEAYIDKLKSFHDSKVAYAVETGFSNYDTDKTDPEVLAQARKYVRPFANVLFESLGGTHGAKNWENSIGWAEVIGLGYNILQTNNSADLAAYIYANYAPGAKDPDNGIEARYFNDFIRNGAKDSGAPDPSIKLTDGGVKLFSGNYIAFHDIDLSSTLDEYFLINVIDVSGSAILNVRMDSPTGPVLATYNFSSAGLKSYELTSASYGVKDIYVCVDSISSGAYVTVGRMSTAKNLQGNAAYISKASVFTRPGTAPALPETVNVVTEYGNEYNAKVKWNEIPSSCYSQNMTYFKVAGVLQSTCEVVYATVTVLDLDMTDASLWFDSSAGVVTDIDNNVIAWYDRVQGIKASGSSSTAPKFVDNDTDTIFFDGKNDYLSYTHAINGASKVTMIINSTTPNDSTDYTSSYTINQAARYTLVQYPESSALGGVWLTAFKNGIACCFGSGTDNNRGIYYNGIKLSKWNMVAAIKNGTSEKLYANANMVYDRSEDTNGTYCSAIPTASSVAATSDKATLGFGIQNEKSYYYTGSVSDIIIFKRVLSDSELSMINTYLKAKQSGTLADTTDASMEDLQAYIHTVSCASTGDTQHSRVCSVCNETVTEDHTFSAQNPHNGKLSTGMCTECDHVKGDPFAGFIQFASSKDDGHLLRLVMVIDKDIVDDATFDSFNIVITVDGKMGIINSRQLSAYTSVSAAGIHFTAADGYYIFGAIIVFTECPQDIHVELNPVTDGVADTQTKLFEGRANSSNVDTVDTSAGKFSEYN